MPEWTKVTVSAATLARLRKHQDRLLRAHERGAESVVDITERNGGQRGNGVSVDQLVNLLLDREERHMARKRDSQARRRQLRAAREEAVREDAQGAELLGRGNPGAWAPESIFYVGNRDNGRVGVNVWDMKGPHCLGELDPCFLLARHSPTGFEWGYEGSGPAQLALAILAHATNDVVALEHYQAFKRERIARLSQDAVRWQMGAREVQDWVRSRMV